MKLTEKQIADLKVMALDGISNTDIAVRFGISAEDVYEARSQLGITGAYEDIITQPCGCCGSAAPADEEHIYIMPDGNTEVCLCDRCALTVDFVNSFVKENDDAEDEETNEPEGEDEIQDS